MIKIVKSEDLQNIPYPEIIPYIHDLLHFYLKEYKNYCSDSSLERIGAIYLLEQEKDWENYSEIGLPSPVMSNCFEWVEDLENGYCNGCIVLDSDRAINIIGKQEYFTQFKEVLQ